MATTPPPGDSSGAAAGPSTPLNKTKRGASPSSITPKSGSSKKRRTSRNNPRTYDRKSETMVPGQELKGKTFRKFWTREGELVAYLTFRWRQDLRRLAMSGYTLWPYIHAFSDRNGIQVRQRDVIDYIRDSADEMAKDGDPRELYPVQSDGTHALSRMALAVCQMRRNIEKSFSSGEAAYTQQQQDEAQAAFKELTKREPPKFDVSLTELKTLGPFTKHGECDLEAYNRCLNLIMYASFSANESTWAGRFGSSNWDKECQTTDSHMPHWMRASDGQEDDDAPPDEALPADDESGVTARPAREVRVHWKHDSKAPHARSYLKYLEDEGMDSGLFYDTTIEIQPTASSAEVRDLIRAKFKMDDISGQIATMQFRPDLVNVMEQEWTRVQALLWPRDGSEPVNEKIDFLITLRQQLEGEIIWEFNGAWGLTSYVLAMDGK